MGRVKTKTVKKSARFLLEKYYSSLTLDFQTNKKICDEVALIPSKGLRNKIAGYVTHLSKRIKKGPVRGISLKLQENEKDSKIEPKISELIKTTETIEVDIETKSLIFSLFENSPETLKMFK
ncbi:rps17 (nucleomorph) [Hemiselmis andersenii]|uniref:Rps17 n=1 Tax=Hemiselmis andersenii TaxID=464988 RepID=A9BL69_HEMAN|nr:rps17 [Hemiselmis andersenii]ABW98252.1 rps17 [Hemiselmis andersenii]|mmetsp:Transcript_24966/g.57877  ORF Transcript_24966/g.57877 Transcript_24966/m.57877 type:complete len:122 (-) Transcript_24966:1176-1541(-)